ncbi:MAG: PQQ-dependent sugar dehydrogenase, partial [Caldilineaceae bacterium]|nr:PQQ-dependent sugar dehydrogenase [Caldilineaceae bacterium]
GLQTTAYGPLMEGSINGPVVVPGDPETSKLWEMIGSNRMPLTGPLPESEKELVRAWIEQGAAEHRGAGALEEVEDADEGIWLSISEQTELTTVPDSCEVLPDDAGVLVSSDLILPVSCGAAPNPNDLNQLLARYGLPGAQNVVANRSAAAASAQRGQREASTAAGSGAAEAVAPAPAAAPAAAANAGQVGIQAAALGLPAPSDADPYLIPQGGFCMERRLAKNSRGITAISFAPDGRMFLALDSALTGEVDPLILYDAYHPSRSIAIYDWANDSGFNEIFTESSRITGLDYYNGALYISRAGEVGRIPDGGGYEKLADGFAVNSQLFHANNGIVVSDGWVYVSAGGMRDGYVEGPIVGVSEQGAQDIVSNGNPYAARIVRAPLDALLSTRSINAFSTAARGVRNPYGIARDATGRIWFTDNGATNVPDEISAGDEVNVLYPAAIGPSEESTPHYGFPLALGGEAKEWYTKPVVDLRNSAAPTGISAAYGTIFYAAYGVDPGLYRLGRTASAAVITERILLGWPILAVATAPDGALWIGMGDGGLYRITPGCEN